MPSFVSHLESAIDGTVLPARTLQTTHAGRPLWVRYDLDAAGEALTPDRVAARPPDMWRYRELLPAEDPADIVTLGEGMTPLLPCPRLGRALGLDQLMIKDESQLPTGSFKSRGLAAAITMAHAFGVRRVAIPTAGNAGGAMAAYAARAGLEAYVFMPADTPIINQYEAVLAGAHVVLVDGLITDCGRLVREGQEAMGWFDLSTLREPYRLEGKKTMGYELAEQLGWTLPDVILYPTGGGTGLIGMWKAFQEMTTLGWQPAGRLPRMVAVQSTGCCPVVRAMEAGSRFFAPFPNAETIARGLRVPAAVGDFMITDTLRASGGCAVAAAETGIRGWMRQTASLEGLTVGPESATCIGAAARLASEGWIRRGERVVIFNCGGAQKSPELFEPNLPCWAPHPAVDWPSLATSWMP